MKYQKIQKKIQRRLKDVTTFQLFLFFLVIFGVVFVIKYFGRSENQWILVRVETAGQNWTTSYGESSSYQPPTWINDHVSEGLTEYGSDGKKLAIIDNVEVYEHGSKSKVFFNVRLRVFENKNTKQYMFKNGPVQVGSLIHFSFPTVFLEGEVIDINPVSVHKNVTVDVRVRDLEPWTVDSIDVGDTMKEVLTGREIARITHVKLEPTASQIYLSKTDNNRTNTFLTKNPNLSDAVIQLELDVEERNGIYYFGGDQMIKNSLSIFCNFGDYYLSWMEIVDIHE